MKYSQRPSSGGIYRVRHDRNPLIDRWIEAEAKSATSRSWSDVIALAEGPDLLVPQVSGCRRHLPYGAHGYRSHAWPEGERLLSRIHDQADHEVVAESLC
jgi:hypothetical protein